MDKKYFAVQLLPCRPDFAQTLSDEERRIMQEHAAYWRKLMDADKVVVFGPVLHPAGAYGLGIVCVEQEEEVKEIIAGDPAALLNKFEYYPMLAVRK